MTELNRVLNPELKPEPNPPSGADPEAQESRIDWPESPAGAAAQDPDVGALLERLGALPDLPVADHGEVYAGLHDDLMEALNADPSEQTQQNSSYAGGAAE